MTQSTRILNQINSITKALYPITSNCERHRQEMTEKRRIRAERIMGEIAGLPGEAQEQVLKTMYDAISKEASNATR